MRGLVVALAAAAAVVAVAEARGEPTHYDTLGVARTASAEEIKKAYRALSKTHHPDKTHDGGERMVAINAAYEELSDDSKRRAYDRTLRGGSRRRGGGWFGFSTEPVEPSVSRTLSLSSRTFYHYVRTGGPLWVVLFYSDYVGDPDALMKTWDEAAAKMEGIISFGRVNIDTSRNLARQIGVSRAPVVLGFSEGSGSRMMAPLSVDSIVDFAARLIPDKVQTIGGGRDSLRRFVKQHADRSRVVLFTNKARSSFLYRYAAWHRHIDMAFARVQIQNARPTAEMLGIEETPAVVVFRGPDEAADYEVLRGSATRSELLDFLNAHRFPIVPVLSPVNTGHLCRFPGTARWCAVWLDPAYTAAAGHRGLAALVGAAAEHDVRVTAANAPTRDALRKVVGSKAVLALIDFRKDQFAACTGTHCALRSDADIEAVDEWLMAATTGAQSLTKAQIPAVIPRDGTAGRGSLLRWVVESAGSIIDTLLASDIVTLLVLGNFFVLMLSAVR